MITRFRKVAFFVLIPMLAAFSVSLTAGEATKTWQMQALINHSVWTWLACDECEDDELSSVLAFSDRAVPALASVLVAVESSRAKSEYDRGDAFQLHWVAERATRKYHKLAVSSPGFRQHVEEAEYVRRSVDQVLKRYHERCNIALTMLETEQANRALKDPADYLAELEQK